MLIFWTINKPNINKFWSILTTNNKKNQNIPSDIGGRNVGGKNVDSRGISKDIKNLLSIVKLTKLKNPKWTKSNFFKMDFLILEAKEVFIYLQKTFTKTPILKHFNLECHIYIKINTLEYIISKILGQITLNQLFSNYINHKNLEAKFFKSKIS